MSKSAGGASSTVRVLHRADDSGSASSEEESSEAVVQRLQKQVERLEQAKASAAAERKRVCDELKLEKAGRQRAEELLVRQAKELEACAAAKARLEEAFSRAMSELRYTRLEHSQAEQTIQQLLRELMTLRDIISRLQQAAVGASSAVSTGGGLPAGGRPPTGLSQLSGGGYGGSSGNLAGADGGGGGSPLSKTRSKGKLIGELTQLRAAMAAAESKLGALEAQKERAEENEKMISDQTAKLLSDRAALLNDINTKDGAVRGLQAGLDHLQHQLGVALADRSLLLQQLRTLAGDAAAPELAALTAAMDEGSYGHEVEEGLSGQDVHSALQGLRGEHRRTSDVGMQQLLADETELLPASMSRQASLQEQEAHPQEAAAGGSEAHS